MLKEKYNKLLKEKEDLDKVIIKLTKVNSEFEKRKEEFDKID